MSNIIQRRVRNTYSECAFIALVIQHAKRMRRIILSYVTRLLLPNISNLSHKRHDFLKNVIEYKTCASIFSTTFI
jgi:hypothetical protein